MPKKSTQARPPEYGAATGPTQSTWTGDRNRPLSLWRPCDCGCDSRGGLKGVGYLTGSNKRGHGFTVWITDESVFKRIEKAMSNVQISGGAPSAEADCSAIQSKGEKA